MTADAEHTLVVGASGSGKSTLVQSLLKESWRTIALTTKLTDYVLKDGWQQVHSISELITALKGNFESGFKICLRTPCGPDDMQTPVRVLHDVSKLLHKVQMPYAERRDDRQIGLVVDEAHRFFPHHRPKGLDAFEWTVSEGRDWGINVLFATQRPTNIPPIFRDNATNYYVLMLGGDSAVETVRKFVGSALKLPEKYGYSLYRSGRLKHEGNTRKPVILKAIP